MKKIIISFIFVLMGLVKGFGQCVPPCPDWDFYNNTPCDFNTTWVTSCGTPRPLNFVVPAFGSRTGAGPCISTDCGNQCPIGVIISGIPGGTLEKIGSSYEWEFPGECAGCPNGIKVEWNGSNFQINCY